MPYLILLAIALLFWFAVLRPQQRRQQSAKQMQSALAVGDEVMLTSGIIGVVRSAHGCLRMQARPLPLRPPRHHRGRYAPSSMATLIQVKALPSLSAYCGIFRFSTVVRVAGAGQAAG